ncbi:hypothetical protein CRM22_003697, partial [Opisthorchis felineus]
MIRFWLVWTVSCRYIEIHHLVSHKLLIQCMGQILRPTASYDEWKAKLNESAMHFAVDPYCGICGAALDLTDWGSLERHSHYHAWTLFLRVKGCQIQEINDWPPCLADHTSRTTVPDLPTPFECGWEYCDYRTNDITDFILHVSKHPEEYTDSRYPTDVQLKCLWENCQYVARCLKNLVSHLDSHSQGKRVACPTCGLLLSNFNKFEDHLKRQQIHLLNKADEEETTAELHHSVKPMRCNRCRRIFPTEKLLIAHMQRHVNTVKCPFCDMTVFGKTVSEWFGLLLPEHVWIFFPTWSMILRKRLHMSDRTTLHLWGSYAVRPFLTPELAHWFLVHGSTRPRCFSLQRTLQ